MSVTLRMLFARENALLLKNEYYFIIYCKRACNFFHLRKLQLLTHFYVVMTAYCTKIRLLIDSYLVAQRPRREQYLPVK